MLQVQEYLRSGKTFNDLNVELGIHATLHNELPLVILNYDQIESRPKSHPIVRECRALVLHTKTYEVVARSFYRFFNWGEMPEEMETFDFTNSYASDKEDGSLLLIYWFEDADHAGRWMAHTRGSFNMGLKLNATPYTWQDIIYQALGVKSLDELELDKAYTYICELCSIYNKVVRKYPTPTAFLLSVFEGLRELWYDEADVLCNPRHFVRVGRREFKSIDDIVNYLTECESTDPTYEGIVGCCPTGRFKFKNKTYLALHKMRENLFHPKHLLPFILSGETSELLCYYPEVDFVLREYEKVVQQAFEVLLGVWRENHKIEDQKTFALAIVKKTPFSSILFELKREFGINQEERHLKHAWRHAGDRILKTLFRHIPDLDLEQPR